PAAKMNYCVNAQHPIVEDAQGYYILSTISPGIEPAGPKELIELTSRLNELVVGNHPCFILTEEGLSSNSGNTGEYEWGSDVIRFDKMALALSGGKPLLVVAHETRHRMVLHQLTFPYRDFSVFSDYISPAAVEALKTIVHGAYPRHCWEGEMDAFVIGHVAQKMLDAGKSLEEIAAVVRSSPYSIPYFDSVFHMLLRIIPPPVTPITDLITSSSKHPPELLKRPFGIKQYLLGILAMRIRSSFLQNVSFLIDKLMRFLRP
ncbi:MAG: hypothetical protein KKA31_05995, partial [Candidatus Margulisbacteria bacterium]|nr:hypothetical protein [Candidatus Margulisiibacteriota bacterium]